LLRVLRLEFGVIESASSLLHPRKAPIFVFGAAWVNVLIGWWAI
jgi:hypothetical protein